MSTLIDHARRELRTAGYYSKDADYGGHLPEAVLPLIGAFAAAGHSGGSAHAVIDLFQSLAKFEILSPLSDNPDEWMEVSLHSGNEPPCWQSRRDGSCFSNDGGKTYYDIDEPRDQYKQRVIHETKHVEENGRSASVDDVGDSGGGYTVAGNNLASIVAMDSVVGACPPDCHLRAFNHVHLEHRECE